ncbi:MAG TPA: hypothetical protein VIL31_10335 [Cyclobacteriaceae bacterium]|jgi:hypothetical protein
MKIWLSLGAALFAVLAICSCSSNDTDTSPETNLLALGLNGGVIVMEPGKDYKRDGYSLRVDSVMNDSRCPTGLACIWQGNVEVRLKLTAIAPLKGGEYTFVLNTNPSYQRDTVIQGLKFTLIDVSPHPKKDSTIPYEDYRVTVTVGD